jgi:acyl carrier protein
VGDAEAALLRFVRTSVLKRRRVTITPRTPLFARGLVDSMNVLTLIGYVERSLGRRLHPHELVMHNFRSVRAITEAFLREPAGR